MNAKLSLPVSDSKDPDDRGPDPDGPPEATSEGPAPAPPAVAPEAIPRPALVPEEALASEVDRARRDLEVALEDLRTVARQRLSPAHALRSHLGIALAAGFTVGLLLGLRGR